MESVRDVYLTEDPADAELLLDKAIEGCRTDWVDEIRTLGSGQLTPPRLHSNPAAAPLPPPGMSLPSTTLRRSKPTPP